MITLTTRPDECNLDNIINLLTLKSYSITRCNSKELQEKLIDYLIDKLIKDQDDLKNCLKAVLKNKLEITNRDINVCGDDLEGVFKEIINLPWPPTVDKYPDTLSTIKNNFNHIKDKDVYKDLEEKRKKKVDTSLAISRFLFDTCYDKNRAANLKDDIEKILNALSDENKWSFITLLATAYIGAASSFEVNRDVEWMLEFLRTFLLRKKDGNIEFTLCPSKGDAAAVTYYAVLWLKEKRTGAISIDHEKLADIIKDIMNSLRSTGTKETREGRSKSETGGSKG